ncbi:MAG: FAD-binding oxidoreductase [Rhodocyclaceae bacterium]|nr:FAD-binding oxidoreductase [Rhodocyclaceae bacterium]
MSQVIPEPAARIQSATLVRSERITPDDSPEEVRHLVFHRNDPSFDCQMGQCVRIMAPGQYGNQYHPRLYLIADNVDQRDGGVEFALCVKRHDYIDDFNGERYPGIASNYLCDLKIGDSVEFAGPVGYPFVLPESRKAGIIMIGMGTGIAPFRVLIRTIYEKFGTWEGKVRLFYGAKTGLDMLYMNDENRDLSQYVYQPTFKAFQAISPRPAFDAPVDLDKAIEQNAAEVWEMLQSPDTHLYLAGVDDMFARVEKALAGIAGAAAQWQEIRLQMKAGGRWHEVLY